MSAAVSLESPQGRVVATQAESDDPDSATTAMGTETLFRFLQAAAHRDNDTDDSGSDSGSDESDGVHNVAPQESANASRQLDYEKSEDSDSGPRPNHETEHTVPHTMDRMLSKLTRLALSSHAPSATGLKQLDDHSQHVQVPLHEPGTPIPENQDEDEDEDNNKNRPELSDEEKMAMLESDFGRLADQATSESLLAEMDSGILTEGTLILGVLRLTSHRLAFHAALPTVDSPTSSVEHVLKSGPIIVRRRGPLRSRTRWCELTSDMLTTYPDSTDEGRVRPLRSFMLSSIQAVHYPKPTSPNVFSITVLKDHNRFTREYEVGTEEAAFEWVRELKGAISMYKHRRELRPSPEQSLDLKVSIPLSRIRTVDSVQWMHLAWILNIDIINGDRATGMIVPQSLAAEEFERQSTVMQFGLFGQEDNFGADVRAVWARRCQGVYGFEEIVVRGGGYGDEEDEEGEPESHPDDSRTIQDLRIRFGNLNGDFWYERGLIRQERISYSGLLVVSSMFLCFWSRFLFTSDIQLRYPLFDVQDVKLASGHGLGWHALRVLITGHSDLVFEFRRRARRDTVMDKLLHAAETARRRRREDRIAEEERPTPEISVLAEVAPVAQKMERIFPPAVIPHLPKAINMPENVRYRIESRHVVCLTIGSRGDVQPFIALAKGLMKEGHSVTIVTHEEYKDWVEQCGVKHRTAGGDPAALMKLSVEHTMFSPQFFKETLGTFRKWLDNLLLDSWNACKDADVLIESPSAMAGIHIAEALDIPYFRAFTMPWTRTKDYPHAFFSPPVEVSGPVNYSTYVLFDNIFWRATSGQVNKWRKKHLGLKSTDITRLAQTRVPFLYNFSSAVVPKPLDWNDSITVTGYWFLDSADRNWEPTKELERFLERAKRDRKPLVYIGFGSIVVPDPTAMTRSIIEAVKKSGVRAILTEGWASRGDTDQSDQPEIPPEIFKLDKIPHDWLFPRIDVAVHHGGAGTTGASLRCGVPTLIKPWFGDQFFWATRVQKLGAGLKVASLDSDVLAVALTKATTDRVMKERAAQIGQKIRAEDGVSRAIDAIYTYLPRAAQDRTKLSSSSRVLKTPRVETERLLAEL